MPAAGRERTSRVGGGAEGPAPGTPWDAVRAFGVVFGGSTVLVAATGLAGLAAARALSHGRVPGWRASLALTAAGLYAWRLVPWMRSWGATPGERRATLPGDELVSEAAILATRAVTIDAPVEEVWPWLAQVGQDRGGFYSYAWLENLAGCRLRNADRIHPEWQHREVGETVLLHPATGLPVARFEPGRVLALEGWGAFVLEPCDAGRRTRLLARNRVPPGPGAVLYAALVELPHFVMERRMLLGIKERAEHRGRPSTRLESSA